MIFSPKEITISKNKTPTYLKNLFYNKLHIKERDSSSGGEHMTEDHGVRGSNPRCPIRERFKKQKIF